MSAVLQLKPPCDCTDDERNAFARLVREGFEGSDDGLMNRIDGAACLAFRYAETDALVGIAGLKSPAREYRDRVFAKAGAPVASSHHAFELGWIYVSPHHRGHGIGEALCRRLMERAEGVGLFAMTRTDNAAMAHIFSRLGFTRKGRPYPRRDHELVLYVRA